MAPAESEVANACWYQKCFLDSVTVTVLRIMCGPAGEGVRWNWQQWRDRANVVKACAV